MWPIRFLQRHPILCLLLLTPGIPEYLSGSTSLVPLVLNPIGFLLFVPFNLALYGPGVLLVREAMVRWDKGWATAISLGAAYAILEEGIAVDTFFYPRAAPVGSLGFYGHWLGVNWVWVTGIVMVHVVYSICLPIALHGRALPETRGRSLLTRRGIAIGLGLLVLDVVVLDLFVAREYQFWYGGALLLGSLGALAGLAALGYALPKDLLAPTGAPPRYARGVLFLGGLVLLPGTFVIESVHGAAAFDPAVTILLLIGFYAALLYIARQALGPGSNVRGLVAFALGTLVPIMAIGVAVSLRAPIVLVADAAAIAFLAFLWRKYPDPAASVPVDGSLRGESRGGLLDPQDPAPPAPVA